MDLKHSQSAGYRSFIALLRHCEKLSFIDTFGWRRIVALRRDL